MYCIFMQYNPRDVKQEYAEMADNYDAGSENCRWQAPTEVLNTLKSMRLIRHGMRIVDFAAGTGLLTEQFRQQIGGASHHITAMDLSPDMLDKIREKRIANVLIQQDITSPWKIDPSKADLVAATGVGEYLTTHQVALAVQEASQALKKGGHMAFTYRPVEPDVTGQKLHAPGEIKSVFEKAGLTVVHEKGFNAYTSDNGQSINHTLLIAYKR
jgi:predicted TPR repeat methyltransferase